MTDVLASAAHRQNAPARRAIVGRDDELRTIRTAVDRLRRRQPQVGLEIVGEAGIGKTTLLHELEQGAEAFGAQVFHGRASQFERDLPFGALISALDGQDHGLGGDASTLRHRTHAHIRALLEEVGRDRRALLVLDDVHWADPATLDLIGSLLERPPRGPVLLVLAYRPRQADGTLPPVISTAATRGAIQRVAPGPLDLGGAAEILGTGHTRAELGALHDLCGGNPYFLTQVARAVQSGTWKPPSELPITSPGEHGPQPIPPSIIDALVSELLPLSKDARDLVDAAAILGDPFDVDLAATVALLDPARAASAVDQLTGGDLIRATDTPRRLRFRHPLTRQAIHDAAPAGWRRLAHRRAAEALTAAGADTPTIAHHVAYSAEHGDAAAVELLTKAGCEILARSPASAAAWLSTAWRLLPDGDRSALERQTLLYPLSVALSVRGRGDEALEILESALPGVAPGSTEEGRLILGCAAVEATIGRHAQARRRLLVGLASSHEPSLETMQMHRSLSMVLSVTGDLASARAHADRALEHAEHVGLPMLPLACLPSIAWLEYLAGELDTATTRCAANQAAFEAIDDAVLPWVIDGFLNHVRTAWLTEHPAAAALLERGLRATADGLRPVLAVELLAMRSSVELRGGEIQMALDDARSALEEATLLMDPASVLHARLALANAMAETGPADRAFAAAEEALDAARALGMRQGVAAAGAALAAAHLAHGEPEKCTAVILDTHEGSDLPAAAPGTHVSSLALLTEAALASGDVAAAAELAHRAASVAAVGDLPPHRRRAEYAAALVELHRGDAAAALGRCERAIAMAEAAGAGLLLAELRILAGRAHAAAGDRDRATESLRLAEASLARGGATRLQGVAARELRRLGRRVTAAGRGPSTAATAEPLTARQREIAQLAAQGRSNREIAEALVLSVKTVESHLSAAFVKLGVRSRPELRDRLA